MRKRKGEVLADLKLAEKLEEMFPQSRLGKVREKQRGGKGRPLSFVKRLFEERESVYGAIARLKRKSMGDLVVAVYGEQWGPAMQQVSNLRQLFTLEWQMKMRESGG